MPPLKSGSSNKPAPETDPENSAQISAGLEAKAGRITDSARIDPDAAQALADEMAEEDDSLFIQNMTARTGVPGELTETIAGGAYLSADGVTWHDSEGRILEPAQVKAAKAHLKKRDKAAKELDEQINENFRRAQATRGL